MTRSRLVVTLVAATLLAAAHVEAQWPTPVATVIPEADGYVVIPNVAKAPDQKRVYRAIFDATQGAEAPTHLLPALNMAGVKLFVCGQNLAFANVDPATISPAVTVASDALLVSMQYQNDGYALMSF